MERQQVEPPPPLLAETAPEGQKEMMVLLGLGELGFRAFWVVGVLPPFIFNTLDWSGLVTFEYVKQGQGQGGLGECRGRGAGSLVAQIDLGSQITNPQVPAVEEQAQQVVPLGLRLTAQTPLWGLTSERAAPGEGPVIGCHPVTGMLSCLGLLSLPLQNPASSLRGEGCRTESQPGSVLAAPTRVSPTEVFVTAFVSWGRTRRVVQFPLQVKAPPRPLPAPCSPPAWALHRCC